MSIEISVSPIVEEYLELMGKALGMSTADVVKKIVIDTFADNIRRSKDVRPASIHAEIEALEKQAEEVFQRAVAGA